MHLRGLPKPSPATGNLLGRRMLMRRLASAAPAAAAIATIGWLEPAAGQSAGNAAASISVLDTGADPTGGADSAPAFAAAAQKLGAAGGLIRIPAGRYLLAAPVVLGARGISLCGDGAASTTLIIAHAGAGLTYAPASPGGQVEISGLAFTTQTGSSAAIVVNLPYSRIQGTPSCKITDITITPGNSATGFQTGFALFNIWRSKLDSISMHGAGSTISGSSLVTLGGFSIDNRFSNCIVDAVDTAFRITSYCEGVHIEKPVMANVNTAISTGTQAFRPQYGVNVLGLYLTDAELNCNGTALALYQVWSGWLANSHIGTRGVGPAIQLIGCCGLQFSNDEITANKAPAPGVLFADSTFSSSVDNMIADCQFWLMSQIVSFTGRSTGNWIRNAQVISFQAFPSLTSPVVADTSNGSNQAEWVTSQAGPARLQYTR